MWNPIKPQAAPLLAAALALASPSPLWALPATVNEGGQIEIVMEGDTPARALTDEIESDVAAGRHAFKGHVTITREGETLTADRALYHEATKSVELSGHVRIETAEFTAEADRAAINLGERTARVWGGRLFFPRQNYHLSGDVIERVGDKTIKVKNGRATTCEGPEPSWDITAKELTVTQGGYATASGVSLNTKYAPLLYTPYFLFPVKNERQSGLLAPQLASSSRDGVSVGLPAFWAAGESFDFTFTPVWRAKRGLSATVEGRYRGLASRGDWLVSYLDDHKPQGFTYDQDKGRKGAGQEAKERFWLRGQNNWQVGEWDLNLDLDLVSDPLYLKDFRSGPDGFFISRDLLSRDFGRTLNEYLDPMRPSVFYAQKAGYDDYLNGSVTYVDNLYSRGNRDTIQRWPSLYYAITGRPLIGGGGEGEALPPLRFSLGTRYDYFYRKSGPDSPTDETGHRFHLNPALSFTRPVGSLATLDLSGDFDFAFYAPQGYRPAAAGAALGSARHDASYAVLAGQFEASLKTAFSRVFQGGPGGAVATRHQIEPTVSFQYSETPDQDELPFWDINDRRLSRRTVRYGLLNTFVAKREAKDEKGRRDGYDYFQFLKLGLWTSYEMADNMHWADNPQARYHTTDYFDSGAGPFEIEAEAYFNPWLSARLLSAIDGRTGQFTSHDLSLRARDKRGDTISLAYDYDSPTATMGTAGFKKYNEARATLNLKLNDEWYAGFYSRYDVDAGRSLESYAMLRYQAQCYSLGLIYSDDEDDRRLGLMVSLLGLGSSGGAPAGLDYDNPLQ